MSNDANLGQLAEQLRDWAHGYYPLEAATELLIAHGSWLHRDDFHEACLRTPNDGAWIDFEQAANIVKEHALPASSSELQILGIACELAGHDSGRNWAYLLTGLDQTNTTLVLEAVAHTVGWHELHHGRFVTGWLSERGGAS